MSMGDFGVQGGDKQDIEEKGSGEGAEDGEEMVQIFDAFIYFKCIP